MNPYAYFNPLFYLSQLLYCLSILSRNVTFEMSQSMSVCNVITQLTFTQNLLLSPCVVVTLVAFVNLCLLCLCFAWLFVICACSCCLNSIYLWLFYFCFFVFFVCVCFSVCVPSVLELVVWFACTCCLLLHLWMLPVYIYGCCLFINNLFSFWLFAIIL